MPSRQPNSIGSGRPALQPCLLPITHLFTCTQVSVPLANGWRVDIPPHLSCTVCTACPLQVWAVKLNALFEEQNVGVLLGTMSLLLGIVSRNYEGYEAVVPKVRPAPLQPRL